MISMMRTWLSKLLEYCRKLTPDWQFALGGFVVLRLALTFWSLIIYMVVPVALQNLDLSGTPVLAVFDLHSGERYTYSRELNGEVLSFHALDSSYLIDEQTGSLWTLRGGKAIKGFYAGRSLTTSSYSPESIFPYEGVAPAGTIFLSLWQRFDANWYLKIAARGYAGTDGSSVYFPLYPILIRALTYFSEPMFAAIFISNLALLGSLVLFYRIVTGIANAAIARRSLIYFLIFPTSFFLSAPYTESLFLLFVLASFYCAFRKRWGWAVLWGMFSALARLQGVLLIIPLAYMLWQESHHTASGKQLIRRAVPLLMIPLGTFLFLGFTNLSLIGTYQDTLHARFVLPWENIYANISLLMSGRGSVIDALNLIAATGLIGMLYSVWKKLPLEYTIYALLMILAPMLRMTTTQPLVSMTRYALVVFPMFVVLGIWGENPWANRMIVYIFVPLQLYLSAQFILWGWVA